MATRGDVADFVKKAFGNEFKKLQDKIEKLQTYDSSRFIGQRYFFNEAQLYLILKMLHYTLKRLAEIEKVVSWKS